MTLYHRTIKGRPVMVAVQRVGLMDLSDYPYRAHVWCAPADEVALPDVYGYGDDPGEAVADLLDTLDD